MYQEKIFKITPSGVDYAFKCKRCLWLAYKGIKLDTFFPPIFNAFDLIQKKFLITQTVKLMSSTLPDGRIMTELSGLIGSSTLEDKKGRPFIISGKTDVVVEFKTSPKKYGIIDLKTTNISPSKIEKTGDDEEDTKNITLKINQVIEKMIIKNPKQWIWSHNRWK